MERDVLSQWVEESGFVDKPVSLLGDVAHKAMSDLLFDLSAKVRERAVLLNAEGWETGPVEFEYHERGWDMRIKATAKVRAWKRVALDG